MCKRHARKKQQTGPETLRILSDSDGCREHSATRMSVSCIVETFLWANRLIASARVSGLRPQIQALDRTQPFKYAEDALISRHLRYFRHAGSARMPPPRTCVIAGRATSEAPI